MKKVLLAVCVALVWPAVASGHTVIDCSAGCSLPYQSWVDQARVPTPDVTLAVVETPCPTPGAQACTDGVMVWLNPDFGGPRATHFTFLHEVGHSALKYGGLDWLNERLADAYALCAWPAGWRREWRGSPIVEGPSTFAFRKTRLAQLCQLF